MGSVEKKPYSHTRTAPYVRNMENDFAKYHRAKSDVDVCGNAYEISSTTERQRKAL